MLTNAFNEMTTQVRGAYENLEQVVTERTEDLRESEERLRTVVTSAPVVLFAVDRNGVFTFSEGQGLEALGLQPGEVVGQSAFDVYRDVPQIQEDLRRALAGEGFASVAEVEGVTFESHFSPVRNDEGEVVGIIGVSTDITELEQTTRDLAVMEERNRMAREIHDTLAQGFTGIVVQLEAAEQALDDDRSDVGDRLGRAKALARESLQEARRSVWDLLPKSLEGRSLDAALREVVESWAREGQENASFTLSGEMRDLPSQVQTALLRICQESLTNVKRHAQASEVNVELQVRQQVVRLTVKDDGQGFDFDVVRASEGGGFGLSGMDQRARLFGGTLTVTSEQGAGTLVEATIPI